MSRFNSILLSQRSFMGMYQKALDRSPSNVSNIQMMPLNTDTKSDSEFFRFTPQNMMVNVEDILKLIPFGRIQYFIVVFHFMMFISTSFLIYNYCFFLMVPKYLCTYVDPLDPASTITESCFKEQICSADPTILSWDLDWTSKYTLNNWISLLDIHCATSFDIGLFGSLYFLGFLISCAIFPPLADKYGRKIFVIGVCVVQTICFALIASIPNTLLFYILNFILGASVPLKAMIAYTHLMEWVPGKESLISGLIFCYDGMVFVYCPLLLLYVTVDTQIFIYIALILNVIALAIFCFVYFPESPMFLLDSGKFEQLEYVLKNLYRWNNTREEEIVKLNNILERYKTQKQMEEALIKAGKIKTPEKKGIIAELKRDKVLVYNLALMLVAWGSASFSFYLLNFFIKYMPGDIYINSVVSGFSCFVMLFEGPMQQKFTSKGGQVISFLISTASAIAMCFFEKGTSQFVLYSFVLFCAKSGAELAFGFVFVIHIDLFPTSFLVTSYGICNIFCRTITMFAPIVAEVPNVAVPLTFLVGLNLAGAVGSVLLKKGKQALNSDSVS